MCPFFVQALPILKRAENCVVGVSNPLVKSCQEPEEEKD
jgi:hypothetical protein